jgi:hypothetical protein
MMRTAGLPPVEVSPSDGAAMADRVLKLVKQEWCGVRALLIAWLREMLSRTEMHERKGIIGKIYTRKGMTRKKYLALVECWKR